MEGNYYVLMVWLLVGFPFASERSQTHMLMVDLTVFSELSKEMKEEEEEEKEAVKLKVRRERHMEELEARIGVRYDHTSV